MSAQQSLSFDKSALSLNLCNAACGILPFCTQRICLSAVFYRPVHSTYVFCGALCGCCTIQNILVYAQALKTDIEKENLLMRSASGGVIYALFLRFLIAVPASLHSGSM